MSFVDRFEPLGSKVMGKNQKRKQLNNLIKVLRTTLSDDEIREIRNFLARIAELLVEAYLDEKL